MKRQCSWTASGSRSAKRRRTPFRGPSGRPFVAVPRVVGNPRAITEHKYYDTELSGGAVNQIITTWASTEEDPTTINTLFAPVMGTNFNQRIGRKVQVKSIRIRGFINVAKQTNQVASNEGTCIRLIIFQDQQTNGTQAQGEQVILSSNDLGSVAGPAISMFQNAENFGRFRVLKDKTYRLQDPNFSWDGTNMEVNGLVIPFKYTFKFRKPVPVQFNQGNAGTIADVVTNSWHVLCAQNDVDLQATVNYKCRVMYVDA